MNWIAKASSLLATYFVVYIASCVLLSELATASRPLNYQVLYTVVPQPQQGTLEVEMRLTQPRSLLRELRFVNDGRISDIKADGELLENAGEIVWHPPPSGGTLRWSVAVASRRNSKGYDAWLGESWGVMRAEDLIPRASTRAVRGAAGATSLQFSLPHGWSIVTAYSSRKGTFSIDKPERQFDQPDGWIVMGRIGVRHETISGIRVVVAAPVGQAARRLDILALLHWILPELSRVVPDLSPRLTVVSAGDPMWRGGLSAPSSLYIHADRPLISENATSTLLHEVMHSTLRLTGHAGYDWIVEGLAEYYSLELLRRSGSISRTRYDAALNNLRRWAKSADSLCQSASSGPVTAKAVGIFVALNAEIWSATNGESSLDDLLQELRGRRQVDLHLLREIAKQLIGAESDVLAIDNLPGCRSYEQSDQANS